VRVFLDTNVVLDIALKRPTFFDSSKRALEVCERDGHALNLSWHTLSNLFYILRRDRGAEKTVEFLRQLLAIATVASVSHSDALKALGYGLNDFEDALQLSAAESCGAHVILTRNKADFRNPPTVSVLTPEEFAPAPSPSP